VRARVVDAEGEPITTRLPLRLAEVDGEGSHRRRSLVSLYVAPDKDGWCRFRAPAGQYRENPARPSGWSFREFAVTPGATVETVLELAGSYLRIRLADGQGRPCWISDTFTYRLGAGRDAKPDGTAFPLWRRDGTDYALTGGIRTGGLDPGWYTVEILAGGTVVSRTSVNVPRGQVIDVTVPVDLD
jgi:hypothetical protein